MVGLGIHDTEMSATAQFAIIGTCAYVSRDILTGLKQLSGMLADSPLKLFAKIRGILRGDKP